MPLAQPFLALRPRRRPMPRTQSLCGCDDGAAGLAAQRGALVCSLEGLCAGERRAVCQRCALRICAAARCTATAAVPGACQLRPCRWCMPTTINPRPHPSRQTHLPHPTPQNKQAAVLLDLYFNPAHAALWWRAVSEPPPAAFAHWPAVNLLLVSLAVFANTLVRGI